MKRLLLFSTYCLFVTLSCHHSRELINHFSSSNDTIILMTQKIKGIDVFSPSAGNLFFRDTAERYKYPVAFPKDIRDIKLAYVIIDYKGFDQEAFQNKNIWNNPEIYRNSVCVMSGIKERDTIFIFDENNNKSFRDDPVRTYQSVRLYNYKDWYSTSDLIKSKYWINSGEEIVEDSTWVRIGKLYDDGLLFFVSHHLEATFSIDDNSYQIGIADKQTHYCFDDPAMTLLTQDGIRKDTLIDSELIKRGEYIKLKNAYYRFDTISNNGRYVTLIKERNFSNKIGTQVGMIAPYFKFQSINGDSVSLSDYKDKFLLLVNVSACWSKISSYQCYKDLSEKYGNFMEIIGIDNSPVILRNKVKELNLLGKFVIAEENIMIQESYRPEYCSRTCFLIDPEGRILDKFNIFNWKNNLSQTFGISN